MDTLKRARTVLTEIECPFALYGDIPTHSLLKAGSIHRLRLLLWLHHRYYGLPCNGVAEWTNVQVSTAFTPNMRNKMDVWTSDFGLDSGVNLQTLLGHCALGKSADILTQLIDLTQAALDIGEAGAIALDFVG